MKARAVGLSYPLLFTHGLHEEDISADQRYNSQLSLSFSQTKLELGKNAPNYPPVVVDMQRIHAKEVRTELDLCFKRGTSEAQSATAYVSPSRATSMNIIPRSAIGTK